MNERLQHAVEHARKRKRGKRYVKRSNIKPSSIYVIQCHDYVKIGIASDPLHRLLEMQVGCPYELSLVKHALVADPGHTEDTLHAMFEPFRVRGEWFKLPPDDLRKLMDSF